MDDFKSSGQGAARCGSTSNCAERALSGSCTLDRRPPRPRRRRRLFSMAQWGQGYQYPMQTGYNPQQLAPQPTGFPGQRPGFQQPQPTGFPGQQPQQTGFPQQGFQQQPQNFSGQLQPQQTGFPGQLQPQQTGFVGGGFQQRAPPPIPPVPPVPPIPSQFQQPQQNVQSSGFLGAQQPSGFLNTSSGGLSPLSAQATGFPGAGGLRPLVPQATGFVDPRLAIASAIGSLPTTTSCHAGSKSTA